MNPPDVRELRRLARELELPASAIEAALDCGIFEAETSADESRRTLRQMRRLMDDLGVNGPGAALLVRLRRQVLEMHHELNHMRRQQEAWLAEWQEGLWYDLPG
ncbi:MAG: hypothetical protein ABI847_15460 [Anaerolineales bacterium]